MKNKKLLFSITRKDFDVQTFRSGGPGGQKQNKTESGVRIIHKDSKAVGESRTHRTQRQNKKEALCRLVKSKEFKMWHRVECAKHVLDIDIDQIVDEMMDESNLKIEQKIDGKWVEV